MAGETHLIIVGGGVIGLAAAREAAGRGLRVTVLERGRLAGGASWAAAGMLSPLDEARGAGPFLDFAMASLRLYGAWAREIEAESGRAIEYRESGKLVVALSESEAKTLRDKAAVAREAGIGVEWIEPRSLRQGVPALAPTVAGGLLIRDDFRVDNRELGRALAECCRERCVDVRESTPVRAIDIRSGRVGGVTLADGGALEGDAVLVAAGAWSASLEGLPRPLPVRPIRGQMLAVRPRAPISARVIGSADVYLVPRDDGRLLVGATVEDVGFEEANTAGGTEHLLAGALAVVPELEDAPIVESWSGFRPASADGDPLIGPDPEIRGLFYATGHFRNGILLSPITARVVAALLTGEEPRLLPAEFRCERLSRDRAAHT